MRQASFLIAGGVRGARTTPLRDYRAIKPAPVLNLGIKPEPPGPATKKSPLEGLTRLVRTATFIAVVALVLFGIKAAHDWFDQHFAFGALKPGPYPVLNAGPPYYSADPAVAKVQAEQYRALPRLSAPWHWALIPWSLATDENGRPSFWVKARNRGTVKRESDLPKTGEMGDEYMLENGTTSWVFMLPTGALEPSWIDP